MWNKRQLKQVFGAVKRGIAFASVFFLLSHSSQPIQVLAAEATEVVEPPPAEPLPEQAPPSPPTVQEVLLELCTARGYGEDCARHLLGILWKESNNTATAIGDRGKARGYFQIHYKLHKVTVECAEDLRCSAEWSLSYLERNGYPKYVNHAIQCHNGCNIANGYSASVRRHGSRLWTKPLAVSSGAAEPDFKIATVKP